MPEHLIRLLHAAYAAPADGVTDAELLARVVGKDDAAFELLVRRHANLVWRVCRSVARDHHAAEDAFQAAFLALARKAGSVRSQVSVAGWLHRVAYFAALKARPRTGDAPLSTDPAADAPGPVEVTEAAEVGPLLHAELNRLPEKYRAAVVLCHLDGFTQVEAAKRLGLPVGTVATRVSRGLARLRDRLARRGVAVPAAGIASVAPPELVAAVGRLGGSPPAHIIYLSHGALSAMTPPNWKLAAGLLAAAAGLTLAAGTFVAADNPPAPAAKPANPPAPPPRGPATYHQSHRSRENLRRVAVAIHAYSDEHGHFPRDVVDNAGGPMLSWRVALLPYLDHGALHAKFVQTEPWDSPNNKGLLAFMPDCFRGPTQQAAATDTHVQGLAGPGAMFDPKQKVAINHVFDGLSTTLLLAEVGPPVSWTKPGDVPFDPDADPPVLEGPYTDVVHVAWGDASPFRLRPRPDKHPLKAAITRGLGEVYEVKDLKADPSRPRTDEERRQFVDRQKYTRDELRRAAGYADDRFRVEQELRKLGPLPQPDPDDVDSLEELEELLAAVQERRNADSAEYHRLIDELEKRDPVAAQRIRQARLDRIKKEEEGK